MRTLRSLNLILRECRGIHSSADLARVLAVFRPLGLAPGSGAFTATDTPHPVEDLAADIANPWVSEQGRRAAESGTLGPTQTMERWPWTLVRIEQPQTRGNIYFTRRGEGTWDILITAATFSHSVLGVTADEFINDWAVLLEKLGDALYLEARPTLAILTATGDNEFATEPEHIERRHLAIGWRTWYGPAYVEKFGRAWLIGLPDSTKALFDGGVAHALATPLTAVVYGDAGVYARVWPYLDHARVEPAWPRRRKSRKSKQPVRDEDAKSAILRSHIRGLLNTTHVVNLVTHRQRVKMLPLIWAPLSALERSVAIASVREMLQLELDGHADGIVHLETSELPDDLRETLDGLVADGGRLTYALVPELSRLGDVGDDRA
jgi:hypothetical protein